MLSPNVKKCAQKFVKCKILIKWRNKSDRMNDDYFKTYISNGKQIPPFNLRLIYLPGSRKKPQTIAIKAQQTGSVPAICADLVTIIQLRTLKPIIIVNVKYPLSGFHLELVLCTYIIQ